MAALDYLASVTPPGIQKKSIMAVKDWIDKNASNGNIISDERLKKLQDIFGEKDER